MKHRREEKHLWISVHTSGEPRTGQRPFSPCVTCVCSWIAYWISTAYGDDTADLFNKVCTGVLVLVWVASNASLFVVQYVQYLLADAQTRPSYLQDSAADWIPFDEVVKIDLWASAGKRQTKGT